MKRFIKTYSVIVSLVLLMSTLSKAQDYISSTIDYRDAFDQSKLYKKYKGLLKKWGCTDNVFDGDCSVRSCSTGEEDLDLKDVEQEFQAACLKKLTASRRWAIMQNARESMSWAALYVSAAGIAVYLTGKDSMGGGLSVSVGLWNLASCFKEAVSACYQLAYPITHPLHALEDRFAQCKCFIPKKLWPVIEEKFMIARNNQFEQHKCMEFLEFVLGLTIYKQGETLKLDRPIHEIISELHTRIDRFFDDYEGDEVEEWCQIIKVNISKFVLNLCGVLDDTPRYLSLYGPGGIGKTYFVNKLAEWLDELLPGSVKFEDMIITSGEELEGNSDRPGALLRVLSNQLKAEKVGSVIFLDEAKWLNNPDVICAAKRVFNGDHATVSTTYFGYGVDGMGIQLPIPPALVFVASNDAIQDPALNSRFDVVKYPTPRTEVLVKHALKKAKESIILANVTLPNEKELTDWIESAQLRDFRAVESNVERFILSRQRRGSKK